MRYLNLINNIENWQEYLWYKFRITRRDPLFFRCKNGIVVEVPVRLLHTFKEIFFAECYTQYLPKDALKGMITVIDVGANAGYFSLYMLSQCCDSRVIAYEPMQNNFALLRRNQGWNPAQNLTVVNKAVYGASGKITLRYNARDSFTTAGSVFENELGKDEVEVDTITLAEIFEGYGLEKVDVLKLDCEGSEYRILYDCPRELFRKINCITLETHRGRREDENKVALCHFLSGVGYEWRQDRGGMVWAWREGWE